MPEEQVIVTKTAEPVHVTVTRGQKGGYGWEISVRGKTPEEVETIIGTLDLHLKDKYGDKEEKKE